MMATVVEVMRHAFTAGYTIAQAKHICCDEHEAGAKARAEREAVEEFAKYRLTVRYPCYCGGCNTMQPCRGR